jgi:Transcription activator MBF2
VESNNSTLSGVIEIYIDSPYTITCCKVLDQLASGTGAFPSFNNNITESGGPGHKFVKIDVQGRLHYGMHFKVFVYGTMPIKSESNHHL